MGAPNLPPPPGGPKSFTARAHQAEHLDDDHEEHEEKLHHEEIWLVSYADLMTLLFGFFVILFSMSTLDDKKFEAVRQESSEKFGGQYQMPTENIRREVTNTIANVGLNDKDVKVTQSLGGLEFDFKGSSFFDSGSATLSEPAQKFVQELSVSLKKSKEKFSIRVEGHTDADAISTLQFPSNWELSSARATAVIRMFEGQGWDLRFLEAIGYGASRPVAPNDNADNKAKNRRILIKVSRVTEDALNAQAVEK